MFLVDRRQVKNIQNIAIQIATQLHKYIIYRTSPDLS